MSKVEERIKELGLTLPPPPGQAGLYVSAKRFAGNLVYISGCGPLSTDGAPVKGKIGVDYTAEEGSKIAQGSMLNVLAALKGVIGDLDKVKSAVKVTCFVSSAPDFTGQAVVANGGTQLLMDVFGKEIGTPTRSAVGMAVLPLDFPVETEALFEVE